MNTYTHPSSNIYKSAQIGEGTRIGAFVEVGHKVKIGKNCRIGCGAFIPENVIIEDNVDVGPGTTIDRATLGSTIIRKGVKLDNQIQAIKMNKFDLNAKETEDIALLERKKVYIMGRVSEIGA